MLVGWFGREVSILLMQLYSYELLLISSLRESIAFQRPDLLEYTTYQHFPISMNPPMNYFFRKYIILLFATIPNQQQLEAYQT